jgi:ArsR family transcriptional regulator
MMDEIALEFAQRQAEYCKVFSNSKRILILWILGSEEMSVSDIASSLNATLQNTSQHLRVMKDHGILSSRRDAQSKYYRVKDGSCLIDRNPFNRQPHNSKMFSELEDQNNK